jgi:hypothetical protein
MKQPASFYFELFQTSRLPTTANFENAVPTYPGKSAIPNSYQASTVQLRLSQSK